MRKSFITGCLLLISLLNSTAQWYTKEYDVPDITILNREQLNESLSKSKRSLLGSGCVAVVGGILIVAARYGDNSVDEDDTFFDQILGEQGKRNLGYGFGAAMVAGGTIAAIIYMSRIGKIKSVLKDKYPSAGSMNIYPQLYISNRSGTVSPGVMFTYNF